MKGARKKLSCENQAFTLSTIQNDLTTYLIIYSTTLKSTVQVPLFLRNGFFTFLLQLFGTDFGRGEIFRHCSAKFGNRLADFFTYGIMGFVCLLLPLDVFTTEFVVSLGDAEQVRRKFGSTHVVQDLLVFLEPLNFLLPSFNSKICLTQGNHFFAGVSVHHNQVTSVTGKLDIGDFTL